MALPKIHRLKHRHAFNNVYQAGLRRSSPHLTLRALKCFAANSSASPTSTTAVESETSVLPTQLGVSVSQKVSKRAVDRNRIKRRIQAAFQQLLPQLANGWQLVVVARPSAMKCDYEQFLQELKQLLLDAEVMNGH